jgi:hypothetical protein
MDVVVWLRSLDLGKYESRIPRERDRRDGSSELDGRAPEAAWPYSTRALGELLDAIGAPGSDANGKAPSVDARTTSSTRSPYPEDRERRQVTVMLAELVGSTALPPLT